MRILITGAGGFIGRYLSDFVLEMGHEVYGTTLTSSHTPVEGVTAVKCDIRKASDVEAALAKSKPECVFHLAAQSFPKLSWDAPIETFEVNVNGTINLFEAIKKKKLDPVVVLACSSSEYGLIRPNEVPVKETHELRPLHPYGVSKVACDLLAYQYHKNFGIQAVRLRLFNITGPGRTNDVCADFTKQVVDIEKGRQENVMLVGNLEPKRDITDVRDVVEALWAAANKADMGEAYNICSGKAYSIKEVLDKTIAQSKVKIQVKVDPAKLRPADEPVVIGDNTKFSKKTGWKPKTPLKKTISDMLGYWRSGN